MKEAYTADDDAFDTPIKSWRYVAQNKVILKLVISAAQYQPIKNLSADCDIVEAKAEGEIAGRVAAEWHRNCP